MAVPTEGEDALAKMAFSFAQEFISMGWSEKNVACLFQQPFYRGAYLVYQRKGPAFVDDVIRRAKEEHRERLGRFSRARKPEPR